MEDHMVDPERAQAILREYYATASDTQVVEDLRRHSPRLARRLGVADGPLPTVERKSVLRGFFASFSRSLHRLFS